MPDRAEATQLALSVDRDALARVLPHRWDVLDTAAFDHDGFHAWQQFIPDPTPTTFESNPSEVAGESLTNAQARGLQVIAVVPLAGHFSQRFEENGLLMGAESYLNADLLRKAISGF